MNNKNKIIYDKMNNELLKKIEELEKDNKYGTLSITSQYQIFKGQLTKDFVIKTEFKETIKLED